MLGSAGETSPRFDAKAAGAAIVAIAIALAIVLVVQAGTATAAPTDVVVRTKAPVKPKQFRGDVRRLKRPFRSRAGRPSSPESNTKRKRRKERRRGLGLPRPRFRRRRRACPPRPSTSPASVTSPRGAEAGLPTPSVTSSENHYVQAVNTSIGIWGEDRRRTAGGVHIRLAVERRRAPGCRATLATTAIRP